MSNYTPETQTAAIDLILEAIEEFRPGGNYDDRIREVHPEARTREEVSGAMDEIARRLAARSAALHRLING
jgi:hypothetical protein